MIRKSGAGSTTSEIGMRRPSRLVLPSPLEGDDAALPVPRLLQQAFQAVEVPERDDACAIRTARIIRRGPRHEVARMVDESLRSARGTRQ